MKHDRSAYLFQRYIDKTCTPAELQEFFAIVRNGDEAEVLDIILDNFWKTAEETELGEGKPEIILNKVFSSGVSPFKRALKFSGKWIGLAAAILIISIAVIFLLKLEEQVPIIGERFTANSARAEMNPVTITTLNNHQKIILPDGSTVILNHNSSLSYTPNFKDQRVVTLIGEGFFDVKHQKNNSFIVNAGKVKTRVLGTAFNIRAYQGAKTIEVTVARGRVGVQTDRSKFTVLTPNQQVVFNVKVNRSTVAPVIAKDIIQWQQNDLFFDDVSMEQAAQVLSEKFNIPISFDNGGVKTCRFTATFLKGESLDEILKIICAYNHAQYQTSAGGVTIKGGGCE